MTPHPPARPSRPALTGLAALTLAALALAALAAGCSVDGELIHGPEFRCQDDSDCVRNYQCIGATPDQPGICRRFAPVDGNECLDRDGDGYRAGRDCPDGIPLDCDDNNSLVHPGRTEQCNGIDDNCSGVIDDVAPIPCPLQLGVCAGSMRACVDGDWQDCAAEGLYGPDYELVEVSCDGLNNDCVGGADEHCDCDPGVTPPNQCGTDIGPCHRGIRFCEASGSFSDCVTATLGDDCDDDDDCGDDGFCIDETLDFREDFFDDCTINSDPGCGRRVCRHLLGTTTCTTTAQCAGGELCVAGACQRGVRLPTDAVEVCNGVDDDCDAMIDEGNVCGTCPFGTTFVPGAGVAGVCVGRWEASRPDATANNAGTFELYASSRPDVLPWTGVNTDAARAACEGTAYNQRVGGQAVPQMRLCLSTDLAAACGGTYPYGATFEEGTCNDGTTGADVQPTGSEPGCCVGPPGGEVCDLSGNVAEILREPFAGAGFGGHTGTSTPGDLACGAHDIDNVAGGLVGFRCCANPR
jgi:hypothetical protein